MNKLREAIWMALGETNLDGKLTVREAAQLEKAILANMPHPHQAAADHEDCMTCDKTFTEGNHS